MFPWWTFSLCSNSLAYRQGLVHEIFIFRTTNLGRSRQISGDNSLSVLNLKSRREEYRITVGTIPYGAALSDDEKTAYVTNWGEGTLSFVDLVRRKEVKRIALCNLPYTIVVPPKANFALASCFARESLAKINLDTRSVLGFIGVGRSPWGLAISGNGNTIAAANFYSGAISLLTPAKIGETRGGGIYSQGYLVHTLQVAGKVKNLVSNQSGTRIVWTDLQNNTVNVLDTSTGKTIYRIPVGHAPYGVDFVP